ncbi:O-antigen ligase family protein [Flavobacterium sp.]|uniref:O-antigen ligase family protein n=1 Tax=Flavobacterium sp. TaxID=239 RepID=UPI003528425D
MDKLTKNENNKIVLKSGLSFTGLVRNNNHFMLVILMIFSYFYNLPVVGYSLKGDNELRLYDLLGVFVVFIYSVNFKFYYAIINKVDVFKWLNKFLIWCSLTLVGTLFFSIFKDKFSVFMQSVLYLYHFWIFYITSIMLYVICFNKTKLKLFIYFILFCSVFSCLIIVLQNFGLIPFLWSDNYYRGYGGFLSGTLGPNKIVTGMFSLILFVFSVGLFFNKKVSIPKSIIIFVILINLYVLLLSGSRTSYLGLLVFIAFFAFYRTSGFVFFGTIVGVIFGFFVTTNKDLYDKVDEVVNNRVFDKIENEEDLQNARVGELYDDLGAGRNQLSLNYLEYLLNNPEVIPLGLGFNNRLTKGFSAHNMYLNVIKELGIVGFILYFGWLINYLLISFNRYKGEALALKGLVVSMLVTLFFGEHLYVYRPLFAILGLFLVVVNILISTLHDNEPENVRYKNRYSNSIL